MGSKSRLPRFSWPGISIDAAGAHVLYARCERRESTIVSLED